MKKFAIYLFPLVLVLVGAIFIAAKFMVHAEESQPNLFFALASDKTQVRPGEEFEYTIQVQNRETSRTFTNVIAQVLLSSDVSYVPGSGQEEKNGTFYPVIDNWLNTGVNLGKLVPGQLAYMHFEVKVNGGDAVGTTITSAAQTTADGVPTSAVQFSLQVVSPDQVAILRGGDFLKVANISQSGGNGWQDNVNANAQDVIEYLVYIRNDGQYDARNVTILANLPDRNHMSADLVPSVTLASDNSNTVTDSVGVHVSRPAWLEIKTGYARKTGSTGIYDCTTNDAEGGCPIPESFYHDPLNIGTVGSGEAKTIQIVFKSDVLTYATVTPSPTPTPSTSPSPTPTPTPSVTPTPTPSPSPSPTPPTCNRSCNQDSDCGDSNYICTQENGSNVCRLAINTGDSSCQVPTCNKSCNQDSDCNDSNYECLSNGNGGGNCRLKVNPNNAQCQYEGGFIVRKYFDHNGNGIQDNGDEGLDWTFMWDSNGDNNWRTYNTFASASGQGGRVSLPDGTQVRIREVGESGWNATTPTEQDITIRTGTTQTISFGNWTGKPTPTTLPPITTLPKSGSNLMGGLVVSMILGTMGLALSALAL